MASRRKQPMQFIVSTDGRKADLKTRKLIRSHVMQGKNCRRKPGTRSSKPLNWTFEVVSSDPTRDLPVMQVQPAPSLIPFEQHCGLALGAQHSIIPARVGSDLSGAEFAIPLDLTRIKEVLAYLSPIVLATMFPLAEAINLRQNHKPCIDLLAVDTAYLHISVFAAESLIDRLSGQPKINQDAMMHFLRAVQLLRERFQQEDEDAKISDATIGVVITLAKVAHTIGDYKNSQTHMKAVRRMITMRGGLSAFQHQWNMIEIFRCDIGIALHNDSLPFFYNDPFMEPFVPYPEIKTPSPTQPSSMTPCFHSFETILPSLDKNLAASLTAMHRFSCLASTALTTHRQLVTVEFVQNTMTSTMYRLLGMKFDASPLDEIVHLGLLSLSHHIFLQWKDIKLPHSYLPLKYKDCLLALGPSVGDIPSYILPRIKVWLVIVGAISLFKSSAESWLQEYLSEQLHQCQIQSWSEVRDVLKSFLWIDRLLDASGEDAFKAISAL